jgi:hypothetical protein
MIAEGVDRAAHGAGKNLGVVHVLQVNRVCGLLPSPDGAPLDAPHALQVSFRP